MYNLKLLKHTNVYQTNVKQMHGKYVKQYTNKIRFHDQTQAEFEDTKWVIRSCKSKKD